MAAECLGKMCLIDNANITPILRSLLGNEDAKKRWSMITAVKFSVGEYSFFDKDFFTEAAMTLMTDSDIKVRHATMQTINSVAFHHAAYVKPLLAEAGFFDLLFGEMVKNPDLIHKIQLGPFSHTVDDGLPLRKAAYACVSTFLDMCPEDMHTHMDAFMTKLKDGLLDQVRWPLIFF